MLRSLGVVCSNRRTKREIVSSYSPPPSGNNPLPAGSASFTGDNIPTWIPDANATGYRVYFSATQQAGDSPDLYTYWYDVSGQSSFNLPLSGIQAGTWRYRVAPIQFGIPGDLGIEYAVTAS